MSDWALPANYRYQWKDKVIFMKIPQAIDLKNHWTKHRLVCTHFDAFCMLNPNMDMTFNNFEIFQNFMKN